MRRFLQSAISIEHLRATHPTDKVYVSMTEIIVKQFTPANNMSIDQLNTDYGIAGHLTFATGNGGFPMIHIDNGQAKALISVYSAKCSPSNQPPKPPM